MSYEVKQSTTTYALVFLMVDSTDHVTGKTGLTPTVTLSKNGGAFASPSGAVSEIANGWYKVAGNATDNGTLGPLILHATGTAADPTDVVYTVVADLPGVAQTGDAYARLGAPAGASVSADVAAVQADTNDIQTRLPAALVSGRIDASVGAMATDVLTSTALAASAVTEIQSGLSTLDAAAVRAAVGLASANLDTQLAAIDDYLDTEVAAIKAKTDNLPIDPADASDIAASFSTVNSTLATIAGYVDTEVAAIKAKTDLIPAAPAAVSDIPTAAAIADAVWDEATSGHTTSGSTGAALNDTDLRGSRTVIRGTVGGSPTTTTMTPSALSPAGVSADQFKGRILVFDNDTTTTALRGQATDITANTAAGLPAFTFTALTNAPVSGDTFSIL